MAMGEWTERTRLIVTAAVALGVNLILLVFLYFAMEKNKKLGVDLVNITNEAEKFRSRANQLNEMEEKKRKMETDNEKILKMLPSETEVPRLMERISDVADQTLVKVGGLQRRGAGLTPPGAAYAKEVWSATVSANFHSLLKFINQVEEGFDRFVAFENLTIRPFANGLEPHGTPHGITVDVATYRYLAGP